MYLTEYSLMYLCTVLKLQVIRLAFNEVPIIEFLIQDMQRSFG